MSKFETFEEYPSHGLATAETALLTIWPSLNAYHDDLVLVGGLALKYLTRQQAGGWPGAVTIDVDFGISLAAENGQYGTIQTDLSGLGLRPDKVQKNRLVRQVNDMALYVDFLTEGPPAKRGTRVVNDVVASVFPGIDRALQVRRKIEIRGKVIYGKQKSCLMAVADIGPLLVLKINAFGGPTGRLHPKDAYDVLLAVTSFIEGPEAAITAFQAEGNNRNSGYDTSIEALRRYFSTTDSDAPVRAAQFLSGTFDDQQKVREDLVTVGLFLLGK